MNKLKNQDSKKSSYEDERREGWRGPPAAYATICYLFALRLPYHGSAHILFKFWDPRCLAQCLSQAEKSTNVHGIITGIQAEEVFH